MVGSDTYYEPPDEVDDPPEPDFYEDKEDDYEEPERYGAWDYDD